MKEGEQLVKHKAMTRSVDQPNKKAKEETSSPKGGHSANLDSLSLKSLERRVNDSRPLRLKTIQRSHLSASVVGHELDEEDVPNFGPDEAEVPADPARPGSRATFSRVEATQHESQNKAQSFRAVDSLDESRRTVEVIDRVGDIRTKEARRQLNPIKENKAKQSTSIVAEQKAKPSVRTKKYRTPEKSISNLCDAKAVSQEIRDRREGQRQELLKRLCQLHSDTLEHEDIEKGSDRYLKLLKLRTNDPKFKSFKFRSNLERLMFFESLRKEKERLEEIERMKHLEQKRRKKCNIGPNFLLYISVGLMIFMVGIAAGYTFFSTGASAEDVED